jgi:hypothetical protein
MKNQTVLCLLPAKREHPEKWYREQWCAWNKGQVEVMLPDGTRCDCLTAAHAIEFDFGSNWSECVLFSANQKETGSCSDTGNHKR